MRALPWAITVRPLGAADAGERVAPSGTVPRQVLMSELPLVRHSRVGGNAVITRTPLDSRLRGKDLCTGFPPARERLMWFLPLAPASNPKFLGQCLWALGS